MSGMRLAEVTDMRATLTHGNDKRPVLVQFSVEGGREAAFSLTQKQAERVLYDLHPIVQTLRGIHKKPRLSVRASKAFGALRGR